MSKPRLLHISKKEMSRAVRPQKFRDALAEVGEVTILTGGDEMSAEQIADQVRKCDVYLAGWDSILLPEALAANPGSLRYICGITGTMRSFVPQALVDAGIPLTNWGDYPARRVAEGAMTLVLASLKGLHYRIELVRGGAYWESAADKCGGTLEGAIVGVYGCGVIGRQFIEMLRPFAAKEIRDFDPYLSDLPVGCRRVSSLPELFDGAQVIAIHAGLTPETTGSITAELFALLPDGAVFVNTARGGIVDQKALFAELETGRLRAGLDVLEPDGLPKDHPARNWPNVIFTCHAVETGWAHEPNEMEKMHHICLGNLRRFSHGEPLMHRMGPARYARST